VIIEVWQSGSEPTIIRRCALDQQCKKGPQVLTLILNERRNYYYSYYYSEKIGRNFPFLPLKMIFLFLFQWGLAIRQANCFVKDSGSFKIRLCKVGRAENDVTSGGWHN